MLVLRPIGQGQVGYYLPGPEPGRWTGRGCSALGLDGPVDAARLGAALDGRRLDGPPLLRRAAHRRCGFDVILAAPKSVSLLAALGDGDVGARIQRAHDQAVQSAVSYLERRATWTRRSGRQIATDGLTAAAFGHHWSASGDPHLHTHVVVANLVRGSDGIWSTLDSRALYRHARAAGAVFQAGLRHALAEGALHFDWVIRPSGVADIAGVPRSAIEASSRRQAQVTGEVMAGSAGRRGRATAAGRTRSRPGPAADERWDVRTERAGFDRPAAASLAAVAARPPAPGRVTNAVAPAGAAIEAVLAERKSRFGRHDVIQAVAGLTVVGASGPQLERWTDDFLAAAVAVDGATWTTAGLRRLEQRITTLAGRTGPPPAGVARLPAVGAVAADRPNLTGAGQAAVRRLTSGGAPVELLGAGSLIGQSWVLDAARGAWEASGHRVALLSHTERGAARWQALAGIGPPPAAPAYPTVVIVDGADRWPTAALHRVLADAEARNAKVVLVDGGTTPARRHPASPAMEDLRARLPAIDCGRGAPDPSRLPGPGPVVRGGSDRSVAVVASGPAAMALLVADWAEARAGPARSPTEPQSRAGAPLDRGPARPTMLAMGPEEAEYLNSAARFRLQATGRLTGPAIEAAGLPYQAGDEVRAMRRDIRLGSVPGGTVGVVTEVDPDHGRLVVRWPDDQVALTGPQLAGAPMTHAYATTPAYLRDASGGPVLALGDARAVAPALTPDAIVQVMGAVPVRDRADPLSRLVDELPAERAGRGAAPDAAASGSLAAAAGLPAGSGSLAELSRERDELAQSIRASVPPDPRPELRRVTEHLAWLGTTGAPPGPAPVSLGRRQGELLVAAGARDIWLQQHRGELRRWDELTAAISWRKDALGLAATTRPTRAVLEDLGPRPAGPAQQHAWRQAAQAIEAYRDRWSLPDRPVDLVAGPPADGLGVETARRALDQARSHDHGLSPSGR